MNKLTTTALILIAIALVYIFRDKLKKLFTPDTVINITAGTPAQKCNCQNHEQPTDPATQELTSDEINELLGLDMGGQDWSGGTSIQNPSFTFNY